MTYDLRRINEVCKEHVDDNFRPLPSQFHEPLGELRDRIVGVLHDSENAIEESLPEVIDELRSRCDTIKTDLSAHSRRVYDQLHKGDASNLTVIYVYLNLLQESRELVTSLRKMLRASGKLNLAPSSYRSFSYPRTKD